MAQIGTDISKAKNLLEAGELVAIPTETVYGLAANALDEKAALKIFEAKERPSFDPLIVHTYQIDQLQYFTQNHHPALMKLADAFWPGPLTLLLQKKEIIPDIVTSGLPKVAIRIPNHPLTLELLRSLDFPLAAPSANPFGYVSPTTAQHVEDQLGQIIPYILQGDAAAVGLESTIVGMNEQNQLTIYRAGGLSIEAIEDIAAEKAQVVQHSSSNPAAPGMLKSHYAPSVPFLLGNIEELLLQYPEKKIGVISFSRNYTSENVYNLILSKSANLNEAAQNLFAYIRMMDQYQPDLIIAEKVPYTGLGIAINDRLQRAAAK